MNYEAFATMFAKDYEDQKSSAGADIDYKRKRDFRAAVVTKINTKPVLSHLETVQAPRSAEY